ncbi:hypothetical protein ADEAN_000595700 [Angomonas deanei]|uniref:Uncharacterized protein n=1 Tax=Angomonas deanei TaxID=59799 RepID=A0A7G2CEX8_9TRYP|nr:hypothetical protein ADEAN_000595700 [Angomonas deanei]
MKLKKAFPLVFINLSNIRLETALLPQLDKVLDPGVFTRWVWIYGSRIDPSINLEVIFGSFQDQFKCNPNDLVLYVAPEGAKAEVDSVTKFVNVMTKEKTEVVQSFQYAICFEILDIEGGLMHITATSSLGSKTVKISLGDLRKVLTSLSSKSEALNILDILHDTEETHDTSFYKIGLGVALVAIVSLSVISYFKRT